MGDIATSAYIYAYPLIFVEMTRRIGTNVADTRQFAIIAGDSIRCIGDTLDRHTGNASERLIKMKALRLVASRLRLRSSTARGSKPQANATQRYEPSRATLAALTTRVPASSVTTHPFRCILDPHLPGSHLEGS
jgi:hypothetical protein